VPLHLAQPIRARIEEEQDGKDEEDAYHLEGEHKDAARDLARARGLVSG
jgi:hypothetical protein